MSIGESVKHLVGAYEEPGPITTSSFYGSGVDSPYTPSGGSLQSQYLNKPGESRTKRTLFDTFSDPRLIINQNTDPSMLGPDRKAAHAVAMRRSMPGGEKWYRDAMAKGLGLRRKQKTAKKSSTFAY